ncbi:MAG: 6-phosphogluconolactonase, partial [Planctomycetes bacterium]|nr:6-phosphogluconolactonase [Planctomycetota bacterium]
MKYGKCDVHVSESAEQLGEAAAQAFADAVKAALADKDEMTAVLAAGESQTTFFAALSSRGDIPWQKIHCFNLDDFWDPNIPEKYTCGFQAREQLYNKVNPLTVQLVDFNAADPIAEAQRFEAELRKKAPFDIVCQGIGTSGHLALNEPHVS